MDQAIDTDSVLAKQAIQNAIRRAEVSQSRLAVMCRVSRAALNRWLNEDALPKLPAFFRLCRAVRRWGDYSLDRLNMPRGMSLTPSATPPAWSGPDASALDEIARLSVVQGRRTDAVLACDVRQARAWIERERRWLNALEHQLDALTNLGLRPI